MSSDVTNLHHPGDQIVNRWQWHILRIVTNVWISLILLLAAGLVLVSIRVSRIRSCLTAAAAAGPSSWIFRRLYLSQMHALTRSRPLCYRPLSQRWSMLATSISGGGFVPKESKRWQYICGDFIQSPLLSVNTSDWAGCWCAPWAMPRMWPNDNITWGLSTPIFSTCTNSDSATMNEVG